MCLVPLRWPLCTSDVLWFCCFQGKSRWIGSLKFNLFPDYLGGLHSQGHFGKPQRTHLSTMLYALPFSIVKHNTLPSFYEHTPPLYPKLLLAHSWVRAPHPLALRCQISLYYSFISALISVLFSCTERGGAWRGGGGERCILGGHIEMWAPAATLPILFCLFSFYINLWPFY